MAAATVVLLLLLEQLTHTPSCIITLFAPTMMEAVGWLHRSRALRTLPQTTTTFCCYPRPVTHPPDTSATVTTTSLCIGEAAANPLTRTSADGGSRKQEAFQLLALAYLVGALLRSMPRCTTALPPTIDDFFTIVVTLQLVQAW